VLIGTSCDTFHRNVVNQYISLSYSCSGVSTLSVGGKKGKGGMNGKVSEMQLAGFSVFSFCMLQQ